MASADTQRDERSASRSPHDAQQAVPRQPPLLPPPNVQQPPPPVHMQQQPPQFPPNVQQPPFVGSQAAHYRAPRPAKQNSTRPPPVHQQPSPTYTVPHVQTTVVGRFDTFE